MVQIIQNPRGTFDLLPENQAYWQWVKEIFKKNASRFSFELIETPIFENPEVFLQTIGENTDIVEKEMFIVKRLTPTNEVADRDEKNYYILRPEATAPIARAWIQYGMKTRPQPVKLAYFGPMFRYDRPQKGRFRQFSQFGFEVIGDESPITDAFLILVAWQIFSSLKLSNNIILELNTLGCKICQTKVKKILSNSLSASQKKLCSDCRRRLKSNPRRVLDCKNPQCKVIISKAPQIVDLVCDECRKHFQTVLEYLDDLEIPYYLNPRLVRGLDYYTRTTFEICLKEDESRQSSLGGGGRYDRLIQTMGGAPAPGAGFACGVERIIEAVKQFEIKVPSLKATEIYFIQIGEKAKTKNLKIIKDLVKKGWKIDCALGKNSLKAQLKQADRAGAKIALIMGEKEVWNDEIIVRSLVDGSQDIVSLKRLDKALKRKLKK